jgi:hypothetical protein
VGHPADRQGTSLEKSVEPNSDTIHSVIGVRQSSLTTKLCWGPLALLVGVALSLAACSSGPSSYRGSLPQIQNQTPVATTVEWFKAVNNQNAPLALAHFAIAERGQMEWSQWGPPFWHLRCNLQSGGTTSAVVYCSFATINDPDTGMSNTSFWMVDLKRAPPGPWLITGYGQG